jgi:predicted nucleic acid-binding protein
LREFFDTSVLISAFWGDHPGHQASVQLLAAAEKKQSGCAAHTLAEIYAVMTSLPLRPTLPPEQGALFVEEVRRRLAIIALEEGDYACVIERMAETGVAGARVFDALLLQAARKSRARTIYTWNLRQFHALAPDLADRIRNP